MTLNCLSQAKRNCRSIVYIVYGTMYMIQAFHHINEGLLENYDYTILLLCSNDLQLTKQCVFYP